MRAVPILVSFACHAGTPAPPDVYMFCTDQMPLAPTFTNVQRLFVRDCTTCHTTGAGLILDPGVSYGNLVNQHPPNYTDPVTDESCGGTLVVPGNPDASYIWQKLTAVTPCAGDSMPRSEIGQAVRLPDCELALIHDWIAAGAMND